MSYIDFDNLGLKEVRCMNCNTPVGGRVYVDIPGTTEKAVAFSRYNNWTQPRKVPIKSGEIDSYVEPIVCAECADKPWDEDAIIEMIEDGLEREMMHAGKSRDHVDNHKARHKLKKDKDKKTKIKEKS
uniref:Uncharacterized protein n=1 Tax=viral metagenome TaxID=1070528 RepID=A0A6M3IM46_9ZZZZ